MRGQIVQSILDDMRTRRTKQLLGAQEREQELMARHDGLRAAHAAMIAAQVKAVRSRMAGASGAEADSRSAGETLRAYEKALSSAMADEGIVSLEEAPRCPLCGDTGETGDTAKRLCVCVRREAMLRMRQAAGIPEAVTFGAADLSLFPDGQKLTVFPGSQQAYMARVTELCRTWADAFPDNEKRHLLFTGGTGLGKTYLMQCIANRVLDRGYLAAITTAFHLNEATLDSMRGQGGLELYLEADLLLLDDLGAEPLLSKVTSESLFAVINERMAQGLHTVISTNLKPAELNDRYGSRIYSRLTNQADTLVIPFEGKDLRGLKREG